MSLSVQLGNFLYKNAFGLYKPMYASFKRKQDAFEIELLKKHIPVNSVVLDIGANIGFYAKILSEIVGVNGKVYCYEPDTTNFSHLKNYCSGLKNVELNNLAVSSKTETIKIYTSKELNVDHRTYKPEEFDKEIEIKAVSIDDHVKGKVDFIKMDIQGFEMSAIKGMERTLAENPKVKMISEFWPYGLKKAGSSVTEYFVYLTNKGFTCHLLEKNSLQKLTMIKVTELESLANDKEHYFNIFVSKDV